MPYSAHDLETFNGNFEPPPDNPNFPGIGRTQAAQNQMAPVSPTSPFATMFPNLSPGQLQLQAQRSQFATNHPFLSGMMNGPVQQRNLAFQDAFTAPGSVANAGYQAQVDAGSSRGAPPMRPAGGQMGTFDPRWNPPFQAGGMFPRVGQMFANAQNAYGQFTQNHPFLAAFLPPARPPGLGGTQQPAGLATGAPPPRPATGAPTQPAGNLISYNYGPDTIRNQPIAPTLQTALNQAAQAAGITGIIVNSGGQPATGTVGVDRTGSHRHDHGQSADIQLVVNGRVLDFTNPQDQEIYQAFVRAARDAGATGIGAGTDYMGNQTIHVGYGDPAVWGGTGANAPPPPDWLVAAYNGGS